MESGQPGAGPGLGHHACKLTDPPAPSQDPSKRSLAMEVSSLRSKALLCPTGKDMISQEGAAWMQSLVLSRGDHSAVCHLCAIQPKG